MDLEKDFNKQNFTIDSGKALLHFLAGEPYRNLYAKEILKNQLKILQFMQHGKIDEKEINNELSDIVSKISAAASDDYYDTIANISK